MCYTNYTARIHAYRQATCSTILTCLQPCSEEDELSPIAYVYGIASTRKIQAELQTHLCSSCTKTRYCDQSNHLTASSTARDSTRDALSQDCMEQTAIIHEALSPQQLQVPSWNLVLKGQGWAPGHEEMAVGVRYADQLCCFVSSQGMEHRGGLGSTLQADASAETFAKTQASTRCLHSGASPCTVPAAA